MYSLSEAIVSNFSKKQLEAVLFIKVCPKRFVLFTYDFEQAQTV